MAHLNALDHALLGDIAREVSVRMGEFSVVHDGTGDQLTIPLGPGVAITARLIPVTSRVLGRETRLGTRLMVESVSAASAEPAYKRTAPFDPEILFSRRREVVEWASAAIVSALERLAGIIEISAEQNPSPSDADSIVKGSATNTAPSLNNAPSFSPSATEFSQSIHAVRSELAKFGGHIAQLDSVVWEIYGVVEEIRNDLAKLRTLQVLPVLPESTVQESLPIPGNIVDAVTEVTRKASAHHLDSIAVKNLRESITNSNHAFDFIRQQRTSVQGATAFDPAFDTWDAVISVACGKTAEVSHLANTILWNGDPEAAYALLAIASTNGTLPQPLDEIIETASAQISAKPGAIIAASRTIPQDLQISLLQALTAAVSKTTSLAFASEILSNATPENQPEIIVAIGAIDERRAVDALALRAEMLTKPPMFEAGLKLLEKLEDSGNGRRVIACLVSSGATQTDTPLSNTFEQIIERSPTVELAARAAESLLALPLKVRGARMQRLIGIALKDGLSQALRTNGSFAASCKAFLSEIADQNAFLELAEEIRALLTIDSSEPAVVASESARDRDSRILKGKRIVVVGGFPPRWLDEVQDLGCEVIWFQSEVKARPPLDAIFNAASDADVVIVDRRVSHATTIPLRVFVRQRRIPIQDFVERNKGRFMDMLRSRFG